MLLLRIKVPTNIDKYAIHIVTLINNNSIMEGGITSFPKESNI